jgi:protein phosphatase PTC7
MEGDVLVVGTDGLFDNIYAKEILQAVKNTRQDETKLY